MRIFIRNSRGDYIPVDLPVDLRPTDKVNKLTIIQVKTVLEKMGLAELAKENQVRLYYDC
jgi:hypothetical protein